MFAWLPTATYQGSALTRFGPKQSGTIKIAKSKKKLCRVSVKLRKLECYFFAGATKMTYL